jgi:4-alpha-methyl-delta7-sterol-4alpha-methyl oxidase
MEELWRSLVERCSSFTMYAVVPTIAVNAAYVLGAIVCLGLDLVPSLRKYKLQRPVHDAADWWACIKHVVMGKLLAEIPMTLVSYPLFVALGVEKASPLPSWGAVALFCALAFVVEDAWHYMAHRSLHTRWGFKHIHYLHHHYTTPFGVAANYAHPLESLWTGFGTALPVILLRPHLFTMIVWIMVRQWQAISVHVGYDFPIRPSRFLPFVGGARFHDRHHRRFNRNYAPTFVWLDRLLGTADEEDLGPKGADAPERPVVVEE